MALARPSQRSRRRATQGRGSEKSCGLAADSSGCASATAQLGAQNTH
jgi:hypothetical protein